MMPFIHLGPVTLASFGLCVGIAMLVAYFVLAKDFQRRALLAPADLFVAVPCIAGLVGAKLYHVLESPRELFADPSLLFGRYGFAWFGGLLGGLIAFILLARRYRVPLLAIFDAASPAAALGYGLGRIGCLVSGDGDYGIPTSLPWGMSFPHGLVPTTQRVHPTPIYELIVALFIFWWLWKLGSRQLWAAADPAKLSVTAAHLHSGAGVSEWLKRWFFYGKLRLWRQPAMGTVFAQYLILTGVARFLVEFIRINPRSFFGMTNAQAASLASIILGLALMWHLRRGVPTMQNSVPRKKSR